MIGRVRKLRGPTHGYLDVLLMFRFVSWCLGGLSLRGPKAVSPNDYGEAALARQRR